MSETAVKQDPEIDSVPVEKCKEEWSGEKWTKMYKEHEEDAKANGRPLWRDDNLSYDRLLAGATTMYLVNGNSVFSLEKDGKTVEITPPDLSGCVTEYFKTAFAPFDTKVRKYPSTLVRIVNADCIDFVRALMDRYESQGLDRKVIVLNMANQFTPGGGFVRGRLAQEESLCFRTALYSQLDKKEYEGPNGFGEFTCSLQLNVPVLRKGMDLGFEFLKPEERWNINVVSAAGYDRHKLPKEEQKAPLSPEHFAGVHTKVRAILAAAAHAGADTVVLGALGCGAFANPPDQISQIFERVLREFAGVFEYAYFAILAAPTDVKLSTFQKTLVGKPVEDPAAYFVPSLSKEDDTAKGAVYEAPKEDVSLPSGPIRTPCPQMSECKDTSEEHRKAFEHLCFPPYHAPSSQ